MKVLASFKQIAHGLLADTTENSTCLLNLLSRFRFYQNPEVTFDQVNMTKSVARTIHNGNLSLGFAEGVMHDVFVSSIVGGGEHYVKQGMKLRETLPGAKLLWIHFANQFA